MSCVRKISLFFKKKVPPHLSWKRTKFSLPFFMKCLCLGQWQARETVFTAEKRLSHGVMKILKFHIPSLLSGEGKQRPPPPPPFFFVVRWTHTSLAFYACGAAALPSPHGKLNTHTRLSLAFLCSLLPPPPPPTYDDTQMQFTKSPPLSVPPSPCLSKIVPPPFYSTEEEKKGMAQVNGAYKMELE